MCSFHVLKIKSVAIDKLFILQIDPNIHSNLKYGNPAFNHSIKWLLRVMAYTGTLLLNTLIFTGYDVQCNANSALA